MLKRLHIQNFTVFADADFEFSPGLNVLVGTNGTGKSHVLKLGYAVEEGRFTINQQSIGAQLDMPFPNSVVWTATLAKLLPDIFATTQIAPLIRWDSNLPTNIEVDFGLPESLIIELTPAVAQEQIKQTSIRVTAAVSTNYAEQPVFIPAKEILTLSWILPGSEQFIVPIEKNYLNLLGQLRRLPLRYPTTSNALKSLANTLGGELQEEDGRYYLLSNSGRRTGINMIAEGLRKFGALQKLLANGSLNSKTTLYWDEPESNLNPALLRKLAAILAELARQGFQIILATHSTDLLKEFHILSRQKGAQPLPIKYFGLNAEAGEATRVVSTDNFEFLPDVVALQAELEQADELDAIFAREDQEHHANL